MYFAMRKHMDEYDRPFYRRLGRPLKNLDQANDTLSRKGADGYVCKDRLSNIVTVHHHGVIETPEQALVRGIA